MLKKTNFLFLDQIANSSNNIFDNLQNNANQLRNQFFNNQIQQKLGLSNNGNQFQANNLFPQEQFRSLNEDSRRQALNNPFNPSSFSVISDKNTNQLQQQSQQPQISLQQLLQQQQQQQPSFSINSQYLRVQPNSNDLNNFGLDSNINNNLLPNLINSAGPPYNIQQKSQQQLSSSSQSNDNSNNNNNNFNNDSNRVSRLSQFFITDSNAQNQQQQLIHPQQQVNNKHVFKDKTK